MSLNLDILAGYKTYIAALGLLGLGVYQITNGDSAAPAQFAHVWCMTFGS